MTMKELSSQILYNNCHTCFLMYPKSQIWYFMMWMFEFHLPLYTYILNPVKQEHCHPEIAYMLEHDFIEHSNSSWSSPCILVPKPDGSYRFCTDFRKVNAITKTDSYPIPRIEDCIDKIG